MLSDAFDLSGPPQSGHINCRCIIKPRYGDGTELTKDDFDLIRGRYRGSEIITDPGDRRGYDAKPVARMRCHDGTGDPDREIVEFRSVT